MIEKKVLAHTTTYVNVKASKKEKKGEKNDLPKQTNGVCN